MTKMTKKDLISLINKLEENFNDTKNLMEIENFKEKNDYYKFRYNTSIIPIRYKYFGYANKINGFKKEVLDAYCNELIAHIDKVYAEVKKALK